MLVLGIDPGIAITGTAIIKEEKGKIELLDSQSLTTSASLTTPQRLNKLYQDITNLIKKQKPEVAALESLFFSSNAKTAFIVGQATGVIQLALTQYNIEVIEYTPLQVKMALTGYGRAEKSQIQHMVQKILKLTKKLTPDDVSDAAAIALTHLFSYKINSLKTNF